MTIKEHLKRIVFVAIVFLTVGVSWMDNHYTC